MLLEWYLRWKVLVNPSYILLLGKGFKWLIILWLIFFIIMNQHNILYIANLMPNGSFFEISKNYRLFWNWSYHLTSNYYILITFFLLMFFYPILFFFSLNFIILILIKLIFLGWSLILFAIKVNFRSNRNNRNNHVYLGKPGNDQVNCYIRILIMKLINII